MSVLKSDLHPGEKQDFDRKFGLSSVRINAEVRKSKRNEKRMGECTGRDRERKNRRGLAEQNSFGQIKQSLAICA